MDGPRVAPNQKALDFEGAVGALSTAALAAVALGPLARVDPSRPGPVLCPFRLLTGLPCPFCGVTRSLMALGQGHVGLSLHLSPLGPIVLAAALVLLVVTGRARWRRAPVAWPPRLMVLGAALVVVSWAYQLSRGAT